MSVQALKTSEDSIAETVLEANAGYLSGFGNGFETEALPGALPIGRNSPQKCPYGLTNAYDSSCPSPHLSIICMRYTPLRRVN